MNEIVKQFEDQQVRIVDKDGSPWFVAADVCKALVVGNASDTCRHLDADEKGIVSIDTPSGKQKSIIVSESGLYALILKSRKPQARKFRKWVTSEVLPSIRKTGAYVSPAMTDTQVASLLSTIKSQAEENAEQRVQYRLLKTQFEKLAEIAKPKAEFGALSPNTGRPLDVLINAFLRSSRRPHAPQVGKYIQLLLPFETGEEIINCALDAERRLRAAGLLSAGGKA